MSLLQSIPSTAPMKVRRPLRVLVGCETSGKMREAFRKMGHEAWSCDLLPADDGSPWHFQMDIRHVLRVMRGYFDLFIVHPECTYLSVSGLHWNKRRPERAALTELAVAFAIEMIEGDHGIPWVIMENPVGCLSTRYRKPDQIVQPYDFGDDASKKTCFWLKGEGLTPIPIDPTKRFPGRIVGYDAKGRPLERWSNQTDSGQNNLGPSDDRWKLRAETYPGIAEAFAAHYGRLAA